MQNMKTMLDGTLSALGAADHISAAPGDFIADDGFLHCGTCGERKEFKLPLNGHMVPVLCACGKAERRAAERAEERRQAQARMSELASYSLIDRRFRESTFAAAVRTDENTKALDIARRYCDEWPRMLEHNVGLIFYGNPGTGKTFLSACIANELMRQMVPVLATSIIKLGSVDAETLEETLHRMRSAELVVLDDFGAERDTDFMRERVYSVIDSRYANKRPMIITTNIDLATMRENTDISVARVYQRIRAMCRVVKLQGASWRAREAAALFEMED